MQQDIHRHAGTAAPDNRREALVDAALKLFGERGFDGTSTRAIASEAKVNSAMIAYYFNGKEGLRHACAERIVAQITATAGSVPVPEPEALTPDLAVELMERILRAMVGFMIAGPQGQAIVNFMMREMLQPSKSLDHIYAEMIRPMHMRFCMLWAAATGGEAESPKTRLEVFSMIGQMAYFRIGRQVVIRRMGWDDIGPGEAGQIGDVLVANLRASVAGARHEGSRP